MRKFTINDSNIMKGTAIILMLIHHLFFSEEYIQKCTLILPFEGNFLLLLSSLSKVCVAIFVVISGYGLYKSYISTSGAFSESSC